MFAAQACAQKGLYDEIEDFYQGTKKEGYSYDPPLRFITENDIPLKDDQGIIQIFLIRHGIPKIDRANWVSYYQASSFVKAYDTVEVYEIKDVPVNIRADEIDNVYSSPLRRARSTAEQLFGQRFNIIYDSLFREFRNEIVPIPRIRLPLSVWRVSSRIFWMVGLHSSEVPGLPEERRRANRAAEQLANMAKQEGHVVLVAHGFINRFIIRYLKKNGWQHSYDGGFEYTNVQVLSKIIENYPAVEVD
ncbi:MAG: histidine phosphatase family protein [Cyclobacteriaceae bacterium]|nr:histidine phosphatase family protein [Cyclobacteriaceae bacterium]